MKYRTIRAAAILAAMAATMATMAGCGWGYDSNEEGGSAIRLHSAADSQGTATPQAESDPTPIPIEKEKDVAMAGIFETTLQTTVKNGILELAFALNNRSGKDIMIEHGSGKQYDILIYNENKDEVYRWSNNRAFTLALITRELKAGDTLSFEETWDGTDNEGKALPAGEYTIKVIIEVRAVAAEAAPEELTAETQVSLPFSNEAK